jgi:signal transduction histidine kinase
VVVTVGEVEEAARNGPRPARLALGVRLALLLLCLGGAVAQQQPRVAAGFVIVGLAAIAGLARVVSAQGMSGRVVRVVEAAVTALGIVLVGQAHSPLFPYLLAPAFAGGLAVGIEGAVLSPGVAAVIFGGAIASRQIDHVRDFSVMSSEWVLLAATAGLTAAWIRRLLLGTDHRPYEVAYRLLSELRTVARRLPGGLDPVTIAQGLLESLTSVVPYARGTVLVRSGGERLVPLAHRGTDRFVWEVDVGSDEKVLDAWIGHQPQALQQLLSQPGGTGSALVLPLRIGVHSFGLVGVETEMRDAFQPEEIDAAARIADDTALRLETALLFDDVRELATVEERRRLAREIHDGIAQELASVGYAIDGLSASARRESSDLVGQLSELRAEVSRIVNELRLSIFDLRTDVAQHGGLGAALGEYVRSVGAGSVLTVHTILDESPMRLPADSEAELLRIAQEAITNARRHAGARNLWVTLSVDPPAALLRIEDDGRGLGDRRDDSFGLEVMRERAQRLRGTFTVRDRDGGGTLVEVTIGTTEPAGSVTRGAGVQVGVLHADDGAAR